MLLSLFPLFLTSYRMVLPQYPSTDLISAVVVAGASVTEQFAQQEARGDYAQRMRKQLRERRSMKKVTWD